jgi:adenine-specific DNA-methyltransferase
MGFNIENRRYTGSKAKLVDWIMEVIERECKGETFFDIFAGTGIVSLEALKRFEKVIINDFLYSNNIIYKGFFKKGKWDKEKLRKQLDYFNSLKGEELKSNYFSDNFGDKYFHFNNAKKIGFIRNLIEEKKELFNEKEYSILLSSLIYSVDKISNTVGHYDAFLRRKNLEQKQLEIKLIEPYNFENNIEIYRNDANDLASKIKSDIVYIDPPYNSRQYSRFYHLLETLVKWDKPKLYGVAMKPEPENMSEYCRKKAPKVFDDLINNLKAKYIVVSYNNTYNSKSNSSRNKISFEEIIETLEKKGPTKILNKDHNHFNAGNTNFDDHKEFLFITKNRSVV